MFKELVPILRQRAVLLTVTLLEEEQIRVNIVPKKIKDGDNDALTTPLSVTGSADELDAEMSLTIVSSHLQLKNSLEKAKAEMGAAAKSAQAEAHAKAKTPTPTPPKKGAPTMDDANPAVTSQPAKAARPEPPKMPSLFDALSTVETQFIAIEAAVSSSISGTEDAILAEIDDRPTDDDDEFNEVA
jgi:PRTRC genetic system protein E